MTTNAGASVAFLTRLFASRTEAPVFIASYANDKNNTSIKPRQLITRDLEPIQRFIEQWDQSGRAIYFCVSTILPGKHQRSKETLAELTGLHADIDHKGVEATPAEIEKTLRQLKLPPSCVNFSGHGHHCYWTFHEALPATEENKGRVEAALRRLANLLAGDMSVCEVARLMRLPGTHNSKNGEWVEVTTVAERPSGYTLEELEEWLADAPPVLQRCSKSNGHQGAEGRESPWLAMADRLGFKPPIDVEQRLAAMTFQGPGDAGIHATQLSVSAALINRGTPVDDVVEMLLEATRAAAGAAGAGWDWSREETDIRDMCATWLVKHPAPEIPKPTDDAAKEGEQRPIVQIKGGDLPRMVQEATDALIAAGFPVFVRAGMLVYPVSETVLAAGGRTTITAKLKPIVPDLSLIWLAEAATFIKFDKRSNAWVVADPPHQLAQALLADEGNWPFPRVVGITTNPVLRPDGSLLSAAGYDPPTQLFRVPDSSLRALVIADRPSRADAEAALALLKDLLSGFVFASGTDKAVALSLILTVVARSCMPVAPLHLIRAHTAGTGKSHLVDTASAIAAGRHCPVITIGKTAEESEKRLGALLRESVPIISLDNCSNDLEGELLCQLAERPSVRVRILGVSEAPEFECRSTVVATGNNVGPRGDMIRRTLTCNLVADVERPELRKFKFDPVTRVLENRAAYLEAAITIMRAYQAAGSPSACEPIGSYDRWSALVRAPLIWLGEADPVESMESAREEDTDLANLREMFAQWQEHLAARGSLTAFEIAEVAGEQDSDRKPVRPVFRDLLTRIAGDRGSLSTRVLGKWLRRHEGRIVDGLKLEARPVTSKNRVRQYHVRGLGDDKLV
jgi:putative DNA primase/helicase